MSETVTKSPQESRREKRLDHINSLDSYIKQDENDPNAKGTDTLKSSLTKLVIEEHDEQHREHDALADEHARTSEIADLMGSYAGEDDQTFHEVEAAYDKAEVAEKNLTEKKASVGEFATKHLDVLRKVAIDQATSEGVEINVNSKS